MILLSDYYVWSKLAGCQLCHSGEMTLEGDMFHSSPHTFQSFYESDSTRWYHSFYIPFFGKYSTMYVPLWGQILWLLKVLFRWNDTRKMTSFTFGSAHFGHFTRVTALDGITFFNIPFFENDSPKHATSLSCVSWSLNVSFMRNDNRKNNIVTATHCLKSTLFIDCNLQQSKQECIVPFDISVRRIICMQLCVMMV